MNAIVGNFNGFQIYNVTDPANPVIRTAVVCPGGQGEVEVRAPAREILRELADGEGRAFLDVAARCL